jgi:hypothetical protein
VKVVTTDGKRLDTPVLRYYQNRNEVGRHTFVYFSRPAKTSSARLRVRPQLPLDARQAAARHGRRLHAPDQ